MKTLARLPLLLLTSLPSFAQSDDAAVIQIADQRAQDFCTSRVIWRVSSGDFGAAIHATLMPDGRVLFIGLQRDDEDPDAAASPQRSAFLLDPTPLGQAVPAEVAVEGLIQPVQLRRTGSRQHVVYDDLFCAGHTLTKDGGFFTAGGTRNATDTRTQETLQVGLPYATLFDGSTWTRIEETMRGVATAGTAARWYPSVTRLADGRLLVTSGYDVVQPIPTYNISTEIYAPETGTWTLHSPYGATPEEIFNGDYTHIELLPQPVAGYELLMFGQKGVPVLYDLDDASWLVSPLKRPDAPQAQLPNIGASSVPLPFRLKDGEWGYTNGSMLITGGKHGTSHMDSIDVFDPLRNRWLPRLRTGVNRHHPSTVLLPDGQVLIVGGHSYDFSPGLYHATYVDPAEGFSWKLGVSSMGVVRGYHNVALLLPDGRVLVGGGRDLDTDTTAEKASFQYIHPPYLSKPRPSIVASPDEIDYGERFLITTDERPHEVVLMSPGSMTHSFDFNQRYVQLRIAAHQVPQAKTTLIEAPSEASLAPPGHYMLFVLDSKRVPSKARLIHLD